MDELIMERKSRKENKWKIESYRPGVTQYISWSRLTDLLEKEMNIYQSEYIKQVRITKEGITVVYETE